MAEVMRSSSSESVVSKNNSNKKMKFLLDFVACYRPPTKNPTINPSPSSSKLVEEKEDTTTFSPVVVGNDNHTDNSSTSASPVKKRATKTMTKSKSMSSQWKPSLTAISEDKIVQIVVKNVERITTTVRSRSLDKKIGAGNDNSRARIRSSDRQRRNQRSDNEYRRDPVPVVLPSFSPTAFLF
ncbi:hypothetical protein C5167_009228 [Papaver somniferum]|uniref:Uncharacterized protein n=1 Tax=Papaver somniferum TaxID=3469 RepID=A0A4Y7JWT5_PAPSO|nr:uncharacterized protein LOC113287813 [Papaver somniferum]RZC65543.1 hypothetical protein C5167_009228 [Papaver somniferum]